MGAFVEVMVALLLLALALLTAGALLTRSLSPDLRRLRLEAEARRIRAIHEQELQLGRAEAEKEIAAHVDPLERKDEPHQDESPSQHVGRGQ